MSQSFYKETSNRTGPKLFEEKSEVENLATLSLLLLKSSMKSAFFSDSKYLPGTFFFAKCDFLVKVLNCEIGSQ